MNRNIIVIGDLHGDILTFHEILKIFPHHDYLFLGDLVDAFYAPPGQQMQLVDEVLDLIAQRRAQAVFGNHEYSYFHPLMQCSGWNKETARGMEVRKYIILSHFKPFFWFPQWKLLISHAGLTKQIWKKFNLSTEILEERLMTWFTQSMRTPYWWIGNIRGGPDEVGGLLWNDWHSEFSPVRKISQVFGHTPLERLGEKHIVEKGKFVSRNFNCDVLMSSLKKVIEINKDTGKLTPRPA